MTRGYKTVRCSEMRIVPRKTARAMAWKAYLPVEKLGPGHVTRNDILWFAARGIPRKALCDALAVLVVVRHQVLPLVTAFRGRSLESFSFLVHGHEKAAKNAVFVDLTCWFSKSVESKKLFSSKWKYVKPFSETNDMAGIDRTCLRDGNIVYAIELLCDQSAWYLKLIDSYDSAMRDVDLLKQVGQFLHYFANMSQLVVM